MLRLARIAVVAMVTLLTAHAFAAGGDPVTADYLFREGRKAAKAGDYKRACALFADSLRLDPGPGVMMNLADCEEHLGLVASAWQHWREAAEQLKPKDTRVALAKKHAAALEPRLPRLTLRMEASAPPGVTVFRDGVELGKASLGLPVPVNPGEHTIVVKAQGRQDRSFSATLGEAEQKELAIGAGPEAERPPPPMSFSTSGGAATEEPAAPAPSSSSGTTGYGVALLVVGGLAVGGGVVTGLMTIDRKSVVQRTCDASFNCTQEGVDAAQAGKTLSTVSTVCFVVGGAAVAAGVVLLVVGGGEKRTALVPTAAPGGGGLALRGAF
jgi:hypothetical protein